MDVFIDFKIQGNFENTIWSIHELAEGGLGYAEDTRRCNCAALEEALGKLPGARRMVVGHTIQEAGINAACEDRVFRIDVGLSAGCGNGEPQVQIIS